MNVTYTLEVYTINPRVLGPDEHYEKECIVRVPPNLFDLYYHGSRRDNAYSRAVKSICASKMPLMPDGVQLVCWQPLECTFDCNPKHESVLKILERIFTAAEKALLEQAQVLPQRNDAMVAMWKRIGLYDEGMGELPLVLLQRNHERTSSRKKVACEFEEISLPEKNFSVTTRIWVKPEFIEIAKKVATLITHIDTRYAASIPEPKYSNQPSPTLQLERLYDSPKAYIETQKNITDDMSLDITLDLLIRLISTKSTRNYWA
ncbi:MAG: hypothetical protein LLF94_04825 [Chlamydiales bacterium]|nr:hypothetical protein [Chlamydiales bacterium]